jgi:hypothetical protein
MEKDKLQVGIEVTYIPSHHKRRVPQCNGSDYVGRELGKITSWNESYVFVDYDGSGRGKATRIEDLVVGNDSFYCADEWNSVLDGAFGRCGEQCRNCKPVRWEK